MGSVNFFFIRNLFPSSIEVVVLDVLYHLIIYLWTKRYKCCIKSANYVKLAYLPLLYVLTFRLNWKGLSKSQNFYKSIKMHFCLICIYSIKYLISGKCDLDPVAKPQQASNHTIVLVRVKPSKICHIAHVLMKFECSIKYFYIHLYCKSFSSVGGALLMGG